MKQRTRGLGTKIAEMVIAPIYANLPSDLQVKGGSLVAWVLIVNKDYRHGAGKETYGVWVTALKTLEK